MGHQMGHRSGQMLVDGTRGHTEASRDHGAIDVLDAVQHEYRSRPLRELFKSRQQRHDFRTGADNPFRIDPIAFMPINGRDRRETVLSHMRSTGAITQQIGSNLKNIAGMDTAVSMRDPGERLMRQILGFGGIPGTFQEERQQRRPPSTVAPAQIRISVVEHGASQ